MRPKAVIFDLYGTLVYDRFASRHYTGLMADLALQLGSSQAAMESFWKDSFPARISGVFASVGENLAGLYAIEGRTPDSERIAQAEAHFHAFTRLSMAPAPGVLGLLESLRLQGFKLGLISDCAPAVPVVWPDTDLARFFDVLVFSCQAKERKPAPGLYRSCLDQLGLEAADCIYVGDGAGSELQGAQRAGLRALRVPSRIAPDEALGNPAPDWDGEVLESITDLDAWLNEGIRIETFDEQRHLAWLEPLTDLLHRAYGPLADAGFRFTASYQTSDVTLRRLKRGLALLAFRGEKVVGCISIYPSNADNRCVHYRNPEVHHFGQFAVEPNLLRTGLGGRLLLMAEQAVRDAGGKQMALDTANGALKLIDYYSRHGYSRVGQVSWETTNFESVVMSKFL